MPLGKALLESLGVRVVKENLHDPPKKEKGYDMPKINNYTTNGTHQADLLFLPDDNGFKYALVVVDLHTGLTEAEPIKNKTPENVAKAMETIYQRKILSHPNRLETDPGSEFKGAFKKYADEKQISIRYGKAGRHRQQAVVEHRNGIIGEILNLRMTGLEQISGRTSRLWTDYLPKAIKAINDNLPKKSKIDRANAIDKKTGKPLFPREIGNNVPYEEGTLVHVMLEQPKDYVTGKRLHGTSGFKFRKGDQRFDEAIQTIKQVLLRPDQPVMYLVSDKNNPDKVEKVAYTRNQLKPVNQNQRDPDPATLQAPNFDTYNVKEIKDKKIEKGKIMYLIRWVGFPQRKDWTWQFKSELVKNPNVKKLIDKFDPPEPRN